MLWWRLIHIAWRLSWPHVLTPWRSPLVRWRLETYGVTDAQDRLLHAEQITASIFWRFVWQRRRNLWSFLRWAASLQPRFGVYRARVHGTCSRQGIYEYLECQGR